MSGMSKTQTSRKGGLGNNRLFTGRWNELNKLAPAAFFVVLIYIGFKLLESSN